MPRNSSGTFSLPLPAVVTGTVIESAWANASLEDIAQNISESLDRYGRGGMLAPLRNVDGTEALPSITFTAETGTGLYRPDSNKIGIAVAGVGKVIVSSTGTTINPTPGGFWPDLDPGAQINRTRDRLFVGDAAETTGNRSGTQGGKVPTGAEGASWAGRDATLYSFAQNGNLAVVGFSRSQDIVPSQNSASIGVAGFAIGRNAGKSSWAGYFDQQFEVGTQGYGIEIAVKNKEGVDRASNSYFATTGTYGIWMPGGGDATYGGAPTNPNNTAIAIGKGASTWNRGIVFFSDSLTGSDGTTGFAIAMELGKGHQLLWRQPGGGSGFSLRSDVNSPTGNVSLVANNNNFTMIGTAGTPFMSINTVSGNTDYWSFTGAETNVPTVTARALGSDANVGMAFMTKGVEFIRFNSGGSIVRDDFRIGGVNSVPVNFLHAYGTNAGQGHAVLAGAGTDAAVDVLLQPKGAGLVRFGTLTANADAPVTGYITIKDAAGNIRKLATIA